MDDIDKLIKRYGAYELMIEILKRQPTAVFLYGAPTKKGRPLIELYKLFGLKSALNEIREKHPHEMKESIADRLRKFVREHRHYLLKPDLYSKQIEDGSDLYYRCSWLDEDISLKRILNMMTELEKEIDQRPLRAIPQWVVKSEVADDEVFYDDDRDTV